MQAATKVNLRTSILECRRVYKDMTDCELQLGTVKDIRFFRQQSCKF